MAPFDRGNVPNSRSFAVGEIPLIDRAEEIKLLKEAVDRTIQGEGGVVFLHGEAGIGKTRLTKELGTYARLRGMQVLCGRCPALFRVDGVPPYVLWSDVIRDYLDNSSLEQLYRVIGFYPAEVAKLVPELSQKLRAIPQSFPISPEHEQNRLFEAVSQFITNISREAPLLVLLDNLQWTDPSSLLLLHYLALGVQKTPLLLLGAYRSTDIDDKHPLTPVLTELNRERLPQSVSLKRMSLDDVSKMIRQMLGQEDVSAEFCKMVYDKTRGNPFFVEEVIKSLKEEEVIYCEDNKWKIKEVSKIEFPETVKSVIKKRISRLDDECQNVLTVASFFGNDFAFEALSGVTGIEENKLLEIVEKMLEIGLIKETVIRGEDVYSFSDSMVRDVVHEEVSRLRHKNLHAEVGCALEKVYSKKIDEHLGELAYHFLEAGDKEKAFDYFLKAGDKAAKIYANSEAASYYQSALRLLEQNDGGLREKARILEMLGDLQRLVGEYDVCLKYWNDALSWWQLQSEKGNISRLHRKMASVLWDGMNEVKRAEEHQEAALKILETESEGVELASLYEDMAHMYYRIGDMDKALTWAEKALELSKKLNDFKVIARAYASLGAVLSFTGDIKRARECFERAEKIALDNGYIETVLRAYSARTLLHEENERSLKYFEKGFDLAKKVGAIVEGVACIGTSLASMYVQTGNPSDAILLAEELVTLDKKTGDSFHLHEIMNVLGFAYQVMGEWDKSEQYFNEALNVSQRLNEFQSIGGAFHGILLPLGWVYFDKGEYVKAKEYYERWYKVYEKAGAKYPQFRKPQPLIRTYIELGEIEKAENLIDGLYKFALEVEEKELIAAADTLRAMQFRAQRKWNESIELFEKSLQEFEALGARRWNVYFFAKMVLFEYARVYLERDEAGDREKAKKLLNQALEIFQKMGAKKDIEKVEARITFIETGKEVSKPKSVEYVSTGYADLDKLLYGGIPSNCAVVLTSPSCNERDLLIKSFLETGAKKGELTFYVTINPGLAKLLAEESQSNFYLFVCNPQADAIIKDLPNVFKLKGVENLTDISIALTSAIRKLDPSLKGPRRICIGLISDVLLQHHAVQTRRWLAGLIPELQSEGFTTLALMDPEMHPSQEVRAVLDLFEGEINIFEKETEKGLEKFLKIKKMSNQKYLEKELLMDKEDLQKRK